MKIRLSVILASLACCLASSLAFADGIPITGTAEEGFATTSGDFNITGPGLSLFQALLGGPNTIGSCNVGSVCNFSLGLTVSGASDCTYCLFYDSGSLGHIQAELLVPSLTFTGSALYTGATSMSVPMTVRGTIVGYQLVNCDSTGNGCSLGPQVFTIHISGKGTGQFTMNTLDSPADIVGVNINFTGTATTTPEPISLVLTGTGLAGILIKKKLAKKVSQSSQGV